MRPKKLTRRQKEALSSRGWDYERFLIIRDLPNSMMLMDKKTGKHVVFDKNGRD
ncbi:MAG: DUF6906 family protein [Faecalibacterium sp.]